jgi:hypothetical protein
MDSCLYRQIDDMWIETLNHEKKGNSRKLTIRAKTQTISKSSIYNSLLSHLVFNKTFREKSSENFFLI